MFTSFLAICLFSTLPAQSYEQHSLEWPTKIHKSKHTFGGLIHQFQKFQNVYFHEGLDIITPLRQSVHAPVDGVVDAGYYSYETLINGQTQKTYLSLRDISPEDHEPKLWGERYFEVSLTDKMGNRFELHHIDRESLPMELVDAVYSARSVPAKTFLGFAIEWPEKVQGSDYHHIHYNILDAEGVYKNPFWHSKEVEDNIPPHVQNVYAAVAQTCASNGLRQLKELSQVTSQDEITHLVLQAHDFINTQSFPQSPTRITAQFANHSAFEFDYSEALFNNDLNSFAIHELYVGRFCIGAVDFPFVLKGSENFKFYIQIPVPKSFKGHASIEVSDFSNNTTNIEVEL